MNEQQLPQFLGQTIPYILINAVLLIFGFGRKMIAESLINDFIGYRTNRSMQSPEAWKEAHLYFGKVCIVISFSLLSSAYWVLQLKFPIALFVLFILVAIGILMTEIHLARKFPPSPTQKSEETQSYKNNSKQ
ncbi:MAG: SdpI family protein [Bacillota bacterium]